MILRDVFLYPDLVEFHARRKDLSSIKDQTRHIGNYLRRHLDKLKFHSNEFNRICIIGTENPKDGCVNSCGSVSVYIKFNMDECLLVPLHLRSDYYSDLMRVGLKKCAANHQIPIDNLFTWLDELRKNGYKNEWLFKEKKFKNYNLKCRLECNMTIENFTLKLRVSKNEDEVLDKIILTTPPDEIAFHYKFKDIQIEGEDIVVTTRLNGENERILFRTPIF